MSEVQFKNGGTCHRVLTSLSYGPRTMRKLKADVADVEYGTEDRRARWRRKVWYATRGLLDAGMISLQVGTYSITPAGLAALDNLGPLAVRTPNIRIFERATAQ